MIMIIKIDYYKYNYLKYLYAIIFNSAFDTVSKIHNRIILLLVYKRYETLRTPGIKMKTYAPKR